MKEFQGKSIAREQAMNLKWREKVGKLDELKNVISLISYEIPRQYQYKKVNDEYRLGYTEPEGSLREGIWEIPNNKSLEKFSPRIQKSDLAFRNKLGSHLHRYGY